MKKHHFFAVILSLGVFIVPALAEAAPVIRGISPGSSANLIQTIWGAGFLPGARVYVDGVPATSQWLGGSQFLVFQPPSSTRTGEVDVRVVNPNGETAALPNGFTYSSASVVPVIRGVAPSQSSTVLKTVWGSNFAQGARVYVNNVPAVSQWQIGTQFLVFQPPM